MHLVDMSEKTHGAERGRCPPCSTQGLAITGRCHQALREIVEAAAGENERGGSRISISADEYWDTDGAMDRFSEARVKWGGPKPWQ